MTEKTVRLALGDDAPEARLVYGRDTRESLRALPEKSVHMVVTSPPYWGLRSYLSADDPNKVHEIGMEETLDAYVARLTDVFREVRRVLRDDGTLWVNLGDSYCGGGRAGKNPEYWESHQSFGKVDNVVRAGGFGLPSPIPEGLKPKDLAMVPFRVAMALQADGWWLRAVVPWLKKNCLSGGTWLYVRSQKGDTPMTVKDLARLDPSTVQLWNGTKWTQLLDIWPTERPDTTYEIEFRSGERVGCTGAHLWPTSRGLVSAVELKVGDVVRTARLPQPDDPAIPEGLPSVDIGWFVGLYLAEGSLGDHGRTIQIAGHRDETAQREVRLRRLSERFHGSLSVHETGGNGASIHVRSDVLLSILDLYLAGSTARDKHLTARCWQRDDEFLRALLEGYLEGDGGDERATTGRWRLGFCDNDALARDLRVLAARLGYHIRLSRCAHEGFGKTFPGWRGQLRMEKSPTSGTQFPHKEEGEIIAIRRSRARKFWDLTVADDPHLFSLASGILTHNCMPESCTDRPTSGCEYWFMLSKSASYFYDIDAVRIPHSHVQRRRTSATTEHKAGVSHEDVHGGVRSGKALAYAYGSEEPAPAGNPNGRNRRTSDAWVESVDLLIAEQEAYLAHLKMVRDSGLLSSEEGVPLGIRTSTTPYRGSHFAVFPPKLIEPLILAGTSAHGCCPECGAPWTRQVARLDVSDTGAAIGGDPDRHDGGTRTRDASGAGGNVLAQRRVGTTDWLATCRHMENDASARPVVLDPFSGSATTGMVSLQHGRNYLGLDLNESYLPLAEARLREQAPPAAPVEQDGGSALDLFGGDE